MPTVLHQHSPAMTGEEVQPPIETLDDDECKLLLSLTTVGRIAFLTDGIPQIFR